MKFSNFWVEIYKLTIYLYRTCVKFNVIFSLILLHLHVLGKYLFKNYNLLDNNFFSFLYVWNKSN